MSEHETPQEEGLWRRDPEEFLRDRYGRLVDNLGLSHESAAFAIQTMARLSGLPDPERLLLEAIARWEQKHPEPAA